MFNALFRFVPLTLISSRPPNQGWVKETFTSRTLAEYALNECHIDFKNAADIMEYIPPATRRLISGEDPETRVKGFRQLFGYLDEEVGRDALRGLVVRFFANPDLTSLIFPATAEPQLANQGKGIPTTAGGVQEKDPVSPRAGGVRSATSSEIQERPLSLALPHPASPPKSPRLSHRTNKTQIVTPPVTPLSSLGVPATSRQGKGKKDQTGAASSSPLHSVPPPVIPQAQGTGLALADPSLLPPPPVARDFYSALKTGGADDPLHTFTYKRLIPNLTVNVDLTQSHQLFRKIRGKYMALLAFRLRIPKEHQGNEESMWGMRNGRPKSVVLRGSLRNFSLGAIWPPPSASGPFFVPPLISESLPDTILWSLGFAPPGLGGEGSTHAPATWAENRNAVETEVNSTPHPSFSMKMGPESDKKKFPRVLALAFVVIFGSDPESFVVDFNLQQGKTSKGYTCFCDVRRSFPSS